MLVAYHGDKKVKAKYVARMKHHMDLDHLTQGVGWESNGHTRGCAVGCTLEKYEHSAYETEIGLPEWLARLQDVIFEGLPKKEAMSFPLAFLQAITPGVNVESVRAQFSIRMFTRQIERLQKLLKKKEVKADAHVSASIQQTIDANVLVRDLWEKELQGESCDWSAARSAARSAAWSAAESAAWSAWSAAESAAWSAAESARSAAWSAASAESAEYISMRDDLLELLTACK